MLSLDHARDNYITRTETPSVTGSSVIGFFFEEGVIIAADTLGSYGSLARFRSLNRVIKVNEQTVIAASGDYADFQRILEEIENMSIESQCRQDGHKITPKSLYSWASRVLYNRRSNFDPLLVNLVIGGIDENKQFLGTVNDLGTAFQENIIARGFGAYIILPFLRTEFEALGRLPNKFEAIDLIDRAMKLLFYRDCRSFARYHMAMATVEGVTVDEKICDTKWDMMNYSKIPLDP